MRFKEQIYGKYMITGKEFLILLFTSCLSIFFGVLSLSSYPYKIPFISCGIIFLCMITMYAYYHNKIFSVNNMLK